MMRSVSVSPGLPPPPSQQSTTGSRRTSASSSMRSSLRWLKKPCVPASVSASYATTTVLAASLPTWLGLG
eukprot:scaffold1381_cov33-Phaeocystis_antarctica.AAC.1